MQQLGSHGTDFHEISYLRVFRKSVEKVQVLLKSDKNNGYFTWKSMHFYLAQFFLEWEMFQTKVVKKVKTHILYSVTFFRKLFRLWDNLEKVSRARQATDNIVRCMHFACCLTKATDTLRMCNTFISFLRQQWLCEHTLILHYTYIACLVTVLCWCAVK
jgi:hypothetical protein